MKTKSIGIVNVPASAKIDIIFSSGLLLILSAITPVFIAFDFAGCKWVGVIPVGTSVCVAIIAAVLKTFKYQETWLNYRTVSETLKKERYLHLAGADDYAHAEDKEKLFVARVENLISRENTTWVNTFQDMTDEVH